MHPDSASREDPASRPGVTTHFASGRKKRQSTTIASRMVPGWLGVLAATSLLAAASAAPSTTATQASVTTRRATTLTTTSTEPTPAANDNGIRRSNGVDGKKDFSNHRNVDGEHYFLHNQRHSPVNGSDGNATLNSNTRYDYDRVLKLSLLFYEAQRSGRLPASNRVPWRGDSALNDRGQNGEDLTGGYYDAGDFVKFSFTMASTTTLLTWGMLSYKDAYIEAGEYQAAEDAVSWAADYFMKCHVAPQELYGQVGDFSLDHHFWGRPEELNMPRPSYKIDKEHPGSDLAGETAAALAAVSLLTRDSDAEYSERCLRHARQLYRFASQYRGLYHEAIKGAAQFYESTDYGDELCWSAAWLYRATQEGQYLDEAEHHYMQFRLRERPNEFFYNKKVAGVQVLLAQLTRQPEYMDAARAFCDFSVLHQKRTPKGLVYIEKAGTLCHAANIAFVCLQAADLGINPDLYREFARRQVHYMLGDSGRSFVVGFGKDWPQQPHHAASSCPDRPATCDWPDFSRRGPNPQTLWGALVSGPDENDYYVDKREEYIYNEVTLDYNAGFQSAVAGLRHLQLNTTV